jgi:predicted outer membrane repeat protein
LIHLFAVLLVLAPIALRAQATSPAMALGSANVGSSTTGTVTFTFSGSTTVSSISVLTQGAAGLDFQLSTSSPGTCTATTYSTNDTCTVNIAFAPLFVGTRYGAALLLNGTSVVATGLVTGVGTGGQPAFPLSSAPTLLASSPNTPYSFGVDGAGNLYIPSPGTGIVKVTPSGTETTFFSNHGIVFLGIAVDPAGNVWVYQNNGTFLREFNQAGTLLATTVSGFRGYQMAFGTDGTLYGAGVSTISTYNILTGTAGTLTVPGYTFQAFGVAVDGNNTVYISDQQNNQIIKVTSGGTASVLAITGTAISGPEGIAVDAAGNIYLAEAGGTMLHITPAGVSTPMINTGVSSPYGLAFSGSGVLYMVDQGNGGIYQWNLLSTGFASTGTTAIGTSSTEQDATLENDGNASLTLSSISAPVPAHTASGTTCSTSTPLAVDAICTAGIVFKPAANGVPPETGTETYGGTGFTAATETITGTATGDATQLVWGTSPPASLQNGQNAGTLTVLLKDGSGNPTAMTSSVTLTVTGSNSYSQQYTVSAVNGTATFNLSSVALATGSYSYQATSTGLTATATDAENVYPYQLSITSGPATPITAGGNAGTVQVTIQNNDGTTATGQTTSITLMVTGPSSYSQIYTQSAIAGIASFNLSSAALTVSGSYSYQATATGLTSSATSGETVNVAAMAKLGVTPASSSQYTGVADSMTVRAYDTYGNAVTSSDTAALTSTDSTATLPANFPLGGGSASANVTFNQAGTFTVTASDVTAPSIIAGISASIVVTQVPTYTVTVNTDPATGNAANCSNQSLNNSVQDTSCSLRDAFAAVSALNTTSFLPVINFKTSLYGQTITLTNGGITVTGSFALNGPGAGTNAITLSGGNSSGFVTDTTNSATITLSGLTFTLFNASLGAVLQTSGAQIINLTNDKFTSNSATAEGGALSSSGGVVTVTGSTFTSNTAAIAGGAIYALTGSLTISNSSFTGNTTPSTSAGGGGVYTTSVLAVTNSTFTSNAAAAISGGGIYIGPGSGIPSITSSTFTSNSAKTNGGAIYAARALALNSDYFLTNSLSSNSSMTGGAVYDSTPGTTITSCVFSGNSLTSTAGGTAEGGAAFLTGAISNSLFVGNTVTANTSTGEGGALALTGTSTLTGVTFYGNKVNGGTTQLGGALYSSTATTNLYNVTITGNSALTGGGVYKTGNQALTAYNTVISENSATSANADELNVTASSGDYINTGSSAACSASCAPALATLGNYGGVTVGSTTGTGNTITMQTMLPLPGSPLLIVGSTSHLNSATTDARGYSRTNTYSSTAYVDIGAVQTNYALTWSTQPPASMPSATNFSAGVTLTEQGAPLSFSAAQTMALPVALTGSGTLTGSPLTSLGTTGIAAGSFQVSATGTGDTLTATVDSNVTATSNSFNIGTGTTPTVAVNAASTGYAAATTALSATVTYTGGTAPAGAFTFQVDSGITTSATCSGSTSPLTCTASYATPALTAGPHTITGTLAADANFYTASNTNTLTVSKGTPTISVSSARVLLGTTSTALSAMVIYPGSTAPTGAFTFQVDSGATVSGVCTGSSSPLSCTASYNTTSTTAGAHTITGAMAADTNFNATSSTNTLSIASGEIWVVDASGALSELNDVGTPASGSAVIAGGSGTATYGGIAFDSTGNIWSVNSSQNQLLEATKTGGSPNTYTGGGLSAPVALAVDGNGYVWVANSTGSISAFTNAGTPVTPSAGYTGGNMNTPSGIAIDIAGNVWISNSGNASVTEILGGAAPSPPLAVGTKNATLGVRP